MYNIAKDSAADPLVFLLVLSSDHITGATGKSPTVTIRKTGGAFASPAGAVTEIANGWYQVAGHVSDSNTLGPLLLHATAAACDPSDAVYKVVPSGAFKKNVAFSNFMFLMTDSVNHAPAPSLTVTVTRSLDGAAFAAGTLSAVTEVANGWYRVNFAAGDTNADVVAFRATASNADDTDVTIFTEPA